MIYYNHLTKQFSSNPVEIEAEIERLKEVNKQAPKITHKDIWKSAGRSAVGSAILGGTAGALIPGAASLASAGLSAVAGGGMSLARGYILKSGISLAKKLNNRKIKKLKNKLAKTKSKTKSFGFMDNKSMEIELRTKQRDLITKNKQAQQRLDNQRKLDALKLETTKLRSKLQDQRQNTDNAVKKVKLLRDKNKLKNSIKPNNTVK